MTLDLRTLAAMLAASAILMSVALCAGIRARRTDGFLKWNLGLGLLAGGWLLAALRGLVPDVAAVVAANALLLGGLCLQLGAVAEFGQQRAPRALWALSGPLLFALLLLVRSPAVLAMAASLACAAALAGTANAAMRIEGSGAPRRMLALACDAGALVLLVRAAGAVLSSPLTLDPFTASIFDQAALLVLFATSAAASIAFLLLHRERAEVGLRRLAAVDPLTETFNRVAFLSLAESELARARRSGAPCTLLALTPDRRGDLKGRARREAADRVLSELAAVLRGGLRAGDLVGRYEDEKFCVLLPNTAPRAAFEVAERLGATVAARRIGGVAPAVTLSIGVAPCDVRRAGGLHAAIERAELALRGGRQDGRLTSIKPDAPQRPRLSAGDTTWRSTAATSSSSLP